MNHNIHHCHIYESYLYRLSHFLYVSKLKKSQHLRVPLSLHVILYFLSTLAIPDDSFSSLALIGRDTADEFELEEVE